MGKDQSKMMKIAEEEMDIFSSDVKDFLWKSFDSIGKPGQRRKPTPILNEVGIKKGIDKGQDMLIDMWKKDSKMAALVFGSSGIGGWLVGLAFPLLTQSNSTALSKEDIKNAVQDAVLGIMSSDKINDLKGAMKGIIHTTFIDAVTSPQ